MQEYMLNLVRHPDGTVVRRLSADQWFRPLQVLADIGPSATQAVPTEGEYIYTVTITDGVTRLEMLRRISGVLTVLGAEEAEVGWSTLRRRYRKGMDELLDTKSSSFSLPASWRAKRPLPNQLAATSMSL